MRYSRRPDADHACGHQKRGDVSIFDSNDIVAIDKAVLDEPTSGLDPLSTTKVEATLCEAKKRYTIVIVPHIVQQAARVADCAASPHGRID